MGGDTQLFEGGPNGQDDAPLWTATRSMIAAQNQTTEALEMYLLVQYLDRTEANDELVQTIEAAIENHNEVIENLELALKMVEET